ncbi:UNVERIFIED_CONTAM: hypothetical protein HDU68_003387 [Siphonaria sp. JEL0065]|nr:hypothetical protein HDU68_003387 [Siphonaria sp. JEL0065]
MGVESDVAFGSWIGIGLSASGAMKGADLWILKQDRNGVYMMQDSFSGDYVTPVADSRQDLELIVGPAGNGTLNYVFRRALVTVDPQDLPIVQNVENLMVWAHGSSSLSSSSILQHHQSTRGTFSLTLYPDPLTPKIIPPTDLQYFEVLMPNITLLPVLTTYKCVGFSVPDGDYHVTAVETLGRSSYIHHIVVWSCKNEASRTPYDCSIMNTDCTKFVIGGSRPGLVKSIRNFPAEVGLRLGTSQANKNLMLQIHYNNYDLNPSATDASGLKFYYTRTLRQFDMGSIVVGNLEINLAANNPNPTSLKPNVCSSKCTGTFPTNLTVFETKPHMHMLGASQRVDLVRNGVTQRQLLNAEYYDFNFQSFQTPGVFGEHQVLMPGDELHTTCTYGSTSGVSKATVYGPTTQDEMCFAFIHYYPAMEISACFSLQYPKYELCAIEENLPPVNSPDDIPVLPDTISLISFCSVIGYLSFLVLYLLSSCILPRVAKFKKPEKLTVYLLFVVPEFICFLLILAFFVRPVIVSIAQNSYWMMMTNTEYQFLVGCSFYMVNAFLYDMAFDKTLQPMLRLHHTAAIVTIVAGALAGILVTDPIMEQYILLSGFCLANHLAIDWIPHSFLILRKFVGKNARVTLVFRFLSIWPLTVYRGLVSILFGLICRYFSTRVNDVDAVFVGWTVFVASAFVVLYVSQVWAHMVYVKIQRKDQEGDELKEAGQEVEFLAMKE